MFNDVIPQNISQSGYAPFFNDHMDKDWIERFPQHSLDIYVDHAFEHYKYMIIHTPEVWRWFAQRKILLCHDLINEFKLGYADRSLCKDYTREKGRQAEIVRGALQILGILKATGHQYFHGDAVFPFFDIDGRIIGAYGRRVTSEKRPGHIYHHHWFHGNATFFNIKALKAFNQLILCKSPVEALVLLSAGIKNVIATMGMYSFGQHHLEILDEFKPKEIVLAFDASDSGRLVSGMIAQALDAQDIACRRLPLPKDMDLVSFARSHEDHLPKLSALVTAAVPYKQTFENIVRN